RLSSLEWSWPSPPFLRVVTCLIVCEYSAHDDRECQRPAGQVNVGKEVLVQRSEQSGHFVVVPREFLQEDDRPCDDAGGQVVQVNRDGFLRSAVAAGQKTKETLRGRGSQGPLPERRAIH